MSDKAPMQKSQQTVAVGYIRFHLQPENIELGTDGKHYLPTVVEMECAGEITIHNEKICIEEVINDDGK